MTKVYFVYRYTNRDENIYDLETFSEAVEMYVSEWNYMGSGFKRATCIEDLIKGVKDRIQKVRITKTEEIEEMKQKEPKDE